MIFICLLRSAAAIWKHAVSSDVDEAFAFTAHQSAWRCERGAPKDHARMDGSGWPQRLSIFRVRCENTPHRSVSYSWELQRSKNSNLASTERYEGNIHCSSTSKSLEYHNL